MRDLRKFWKEWSGNFPLTLSYKDEESLTGTPEGVEVERAGQTVFLTKDDIQVAAMLFDDTVYTVHSEEEAR